MPLTLATIAYFTPPANHWWQWSADGPAWRDGRPIAFTEEWRSVLDDLVADRTGGGGLPPAGAVLLVLSACGKAWPDDPSRYSLMMAATMDWGDPAALDRRDDVAMMQEVWRGLNAVHALPAELRAGLAGRLALCFLLLDRAPYRLGVKASRTALAEFDRVPLADIRRARDGAQAAALKLPSRALLLRRDLSALQAGFQAIGADTLADPAKFAAHVRSGAADAAVRLDRLPKLADALAVAARPTPASDLPKPPPDLLSTLAEAGGEAGGAARMARRMLAALSLSRPAGRPEDRPEGGFADLANRGDPQRLLLSELGHDPDVLAARIVHGEAMYLKREVPPAQPARRRVLCLDATLRQWGAPRLVAMAMALALREQAVKTKGQSRNAGAVTARQSHHGHWRPLPFEKAEEVQAALGHLDVGALPPTMDGLDLGADQTPAEVFLITGPAAWRDPVQVAALRRLSAKAAVVVAAVVDREGNFSLHAVGGLGNRELAKGRVEVEGVEVRKKEKEAQVVPTAGNRQRRTAEELPKFYLEKRQPLPVVARHLRDRKKLENGKLVGVDKDGQILLWETREKLPRLIGVWPRVTKSHISVAVDGERVVFVCSRTKKRPQSCWIREFNWRTGEIGQEWDSNAWRHFVDFAILRGDLLHLRRLDFSKNQVITGVVDLVKKQFIDVDFHPHADPASAFFERIGPRNFQPSKWRDSDRPRHRRNPRYDDRPVLFGHSDLRIEWGRPGCLNLVAKDDACAKHNATYRSWQVLFKNDLSFHTTSSKLDRCVELDLVDTDVPGACLYEARFETGARVVYDSRGYLHLIPANPTTPQMSFLLNRRSNIIAWTSDGHRYGAPELWNGEEISNISYLRHCHGMFLAELPTPSVPLPPSEIRGRREYYRDIPSGADLIASIKMGVLFIDMEVGMQAMQARGAMVEILDKLDPEKKLRHLVVDSVMDSEFCQSIPELQGKVHGKGEALWIKGGKVQFVAHGPDAPAFYEKNTRALLAMP